MPSQQSSIVGIHRKSIWPWLLAKNHEFVTCVTGSLFIFGVKSHHLATVIFYRKWLTEKFTNIQKLNWLMQKKKNTIFNVHHAWHATSQLATTNETSCLCTIGVKSQCLQESLLRVNGRWENNKYLFLIYCRKFIKKQIKDKINEIFNNGSMFKSAHFLSK